MKGTRILRTLCLVATVTWLLAAGAPVAGAADTPTIVSCNQFMAPKRNVSGKMIGQEECKMMDAGIVDAAKKYHRVEIGISGTLSGWVVKEGRSRLNHFTSAPDFLFTQFGNPNQRYHGIVRYEMAKGISMTVIYPESGWNGKLFSLNHGAGNSFRAGSLKPWDKVLDTANPMGDVTKYEKRMLEKGFAIQRSRRNADRFLAGDYDAVLDDGTIWPDVNINEVPELMLDMVRLTDKFLADRMGKAPTRNYWYGHSAGAYTGLAINYMADEFNPKGPDGRRLIEGFIDDDPGAGLFIPVLIKNGQDVLYRTPEDKAKATKTIVVAHGAYPLTYNEEDPGEMDHKAIPKFVAPVALDNKRTMARMFREKAMGNVFKSYEVRGVSHGGGEGLPNGKRGDTEILDLSKLMDGFIDLLDNWVEKNAPPPETRSDGDGITTAKNAIATPEVACPLGKYFAYPPMSGKGGVGSTGFAAYDGKTIEPLDGHLKYVDMNGNGKRDRRESVTEVWRKMGLLGANETFSRAKYEACVQKTAEQLKKEGFISDHIVQEYVQEAKVKELPQS